VKRTVIVTGGTKGLGREITLAFSRAGYSVVVLFSSDEKAAQELVTELVHINPTGAVVKHDVCSEDPALWNGLANRPEILEADHLTLVHNACAIFSPVPLHQLSWNDFEKDFSVAVKGAWQCSRALVPLMIRKKGGAIVNVLTSAIDGDPPKGFAAYVTAKHALRGLNLALAAEYGPRGIKVFAIAPGYMDTPLTQQWDARFRDVIRANSGRTTIPSEAAGRILELSQNPSISGRGETYPV
jgi:3-oxoacyl-[acyl-carrier protein] reductase